MSEINEIQEMNSKEKGKTIGAGFSTGEYKLVAGLDSVEDAVSEEGEDFEDDEFESNEERNTRFENFLQRVEKKLKKVPLAGDRISYIPIMLSLLRSYFKKEYPNVPKRTLAAIFIALFYFVVFADFIPDFIPILGFLDDILVLTLCLKLVKKDLNAYIKWREKNKKTI